jgi:anti-sigma factor RsiW
MASPHLSDELLSGHLDGALDGARERMVATHLAECDDCTRRLEQMRAVSRAVAGLPEEAPPRDLDLGFLRGGHRAVPASPVYAPPEEPRPGWVARVIRGRPASFAAGGLAAAAVFAAAILLTPQVMDAFRSPSVASRSTSNALGSSRAPAVASSASTPLAGADNSLKAAAPVQGAAPSRPLVQSQSGTVPGGIQLTLSTSAKAVRSGDQVVVVFRITGGDSDQQLSPYYINIALSHSAAGGGSTLVTSSGDTLVVRAHHSDEIDYQWSVPAGASGPGSYYLVATLNSTVSGTISVPVTIS